MAVLLSELYDRVAVLEKRLEAYDIKYLAVRVGILERASGLPEGGQGHNRTIVERIKLLESALEPDIDCEGQNYAQGTDILDVSP